MKETTNLHLSIFENSDYPSFAPVNENFNKIDTSFNVVKTTADECKASIDESKKQVDKNTNDITEINSNIKSVKEDVTVLEKAVENETIKVDGIKKEFKKVKLKVAITNSYFKVVHKSLPLAKIKNGTLDTDYVKLDFNSVYADLDAETLMDITASNINDVVIKSCAIYQDTYYYQGKTNMPPMGIRCLAVNPNSKCVLRIYGNELNYFDMIYDNENDSFSTYYPSVYEPTGNSIMVIEYLLPV